MGFQIIDGTGNGRKAGVDSTNRLLTRGTNEDLFLYSAENGNAYFIGTPLIGLTSSNESCIFYLKNNGDNAIILGTFILTAESTTGGSPNMFRVNWYKNPTSITSGTNTVPLNQNFGSSLSIDADVQYGAEGSSVTGGSLVATLSFPIGQFNNFLSNLVLEKGSSFAITITPPTGNTSMNVQFGSRAINYVKTYSI